MRLKKILKTIQKFSLVDPTGYPPDHDGNSVDPTDIGVRRMTEAGLCWGHQDPETSLTFL